MMNQPNANMVTSSMDRVQGTVLQPVYQPINNFRIQNLGGNIIQGQLNKISVTEVMFPYTTPTIVTDQNDAFQIKIYDINADGELVALPTAEYSFALDQRFYTGNEIVIALNGLTAIGDATPLSDYIDFVWDATNQTIQMSNATPAFDNTQGNTSGIYVEINIEYGPFLIEAAAGNVFNYPNMWFTAGFRNNFATNPAVEYTAADGDTFYINLGLLPVGMTQAERNNLPSNAYADVFGSFFTGRYTDFVDIVSTSLCQAQFTRDSTTSQNTTRRDVIARIYVCNNMSVITAVQEGTRPLILHRMFPVPKVMKWTADRSIDAIDLQLFDMWGQPLPTDQLNDPVVSTGRASYAGQADYAITFHVHEPGAETQEANIGYSYH